MSVLFLLFMITFLWWRNLFPYLQAFVGWLSKGAQKAKKRLPWGASIFGFVFWHPGLNPILG